MNILMFDISSVTIISSYEEALKLYDIALEENQNSPEFLKRKIAIYKAKGQTPDAIELLTDYLET